MKSLRSMLLSLLTIAILASAIYAEPRYPVALTPTASTNAPLPTSQPRSQPTGRYVSPPGYHRHVTVDGRIIEHGDWNRGNMAAHRGMWTWKYNGPLPPTDGTAVRTEEDAARGQAYVAPVWPQRGRVRTIFSP